MKPQLLNRKTDQERGYNIRQNRYPHFLKIWHYHPELELVVITEGTGTRFVGDSIAKFEPGEVLLLGRDLPHMWLNDPVYFEAGSGLMVDAWCIHFREDFPGKDFLSLSGAGPIHQLYQKARLGIRFYDLPFLAEDTIVDILSELSESIKLLKMLHLLTHLALHDRYQLLASDGYVNTRAEESADKTHEFIFKNFQKPIKLSDVAEVANMNPSAFSRYFTRIHRKPFSRYLIEIRVGFACKLLMEKNVTISRVCYESGFNNISNFNRQFRNVMGMSPSDYRKVHLQDRSYK